MPEVQEKGRTWPCRKFEGHTRRVNGIIHLSDGQRLITCSNDGSLREWNLDSGKQIGADWRDKGSAVYTISLSPHGKKVVSGSEDGGIRLWDVDTGKLITKWTGHRRGVSSVHWNRDGRRMVSGGSYDETARVWDVESGETVVGPIMTGLTLVEVVIYSPDNTLIGTGGRGEEEFIKIWDSNVGKLVTNLKGHTKGVHCLVWTPDGKTFIPGSLEGSIRIWNTVTWEQISVLVEHSGGSVTDLALLPPNAHILASACYDGTVRLWNLENGESIGTSLQHQSGAAHDVAVECVILDRWVFTGHWLLGP